MSVDDGKGPIKSEYLDDDNMLHQLQKLFAYLSFTFFGEVIPKDLIFSIKDYDGNPISPNNMQDSHEFYTNFCDKIEDSLNNTKYKFLIKNLFKGKICNKNTCDSCNNSSFRFEEFKDITLEVNELNNIEESLNKYISEEKIEDYFCSNCNKKVTLKKSSLIADLPNILIIHLNRIKMNNEGNFEKVYSRFEFLQTLDLKNYCIENHTDNSKIIYKKKDEYYKYELKGVNIHKGNVDGGHYISIIKVDKDKWYEFDDSKVKEFDIKNLEEQCFGGKKPDSDEDKKYSAYLLFYELSKKKPIKMSLNEKEADKYKGNNGENIIEYLNDNLEEIEREYDTTKLNNAKDEKEVLNKVFHNNEDNSYFKYVLYNDDIEKNVNKEYVSEVLADNKFYCYKYGNNKIINFNNKLLEILIKLLDENDNKDECFNIIKDLEFEDIKNLINIFTELIISFISDDNSKKNQNDECIKNINKIISKLFLSLFKKENKQIISYINDTFFSTKNIKLIFCESKIEEIVKTIYELFLDLIKYNENENEKIKNKKLHEDINKIINEGENISLYSYKILYELIKINTKDEIDNISCESFLTLYYKLYKEKDENLAEISEILKYLIQKDIFSKKEDLIKEIKTQINETLIITLLDSIDILILLVKQLQNNDENYSKEFNMNTIQKLYTISLKEKDEKVLKKKLYKLIKLNCGIFEIKDEYTPNRIKTLLGYPTLIIRKNEEKNISSFGVNIMNNNINTEIFEYLSFNHIKKKRCVLGFLFPSSYEKNEENKLDENDRCDLIYELIKTSLGLNEIKEGNYYLFKNLYLMQPTSINYDNLYQQMKDILEKANKKNNNKYDLSTIEKIEKECIKLIDYETKNMTYLIKTACKKNLSEEEKENNNAGVKPELSERFKNNEKIINTKINIDFIGTVCNIIPDEIGKIKIFLTASNQNLSIFRLEYFTTYFTTKELRVLSEEKNEFVYEKIKRLKNENDDKNNEDKEIMLLDYNIFNEKKTEKEFFEFIDEICKDKKLIIIENKNVINNKTIKPTLIRYFAYSKNKKCILKTEINKGEMEKDIENNYYLPEEIHNNIEENQIVNIINIHRIKDEYNFLNQNSIIIKMRIAKTEKYIKDYFE